MSPAARIGALILTLCSGQALAQGGNAVPCTCGVWSLDGPEPADSRLGGCAAAPSQLDANGCPLPPLLYESPRGLWYVANEVVALRRDADESRVFATLTTPTDDVLNTNDLQFENQAGLRVIVGRELDDWFALEGSFLGLMQWDEQKAVRDATANSQATTGNLFSPFTGFGNPATVGLDFNNLASIRLISSLDIAELNVRQRIDTAPSIMRATALYGFRYMRIREQFAYRTESLAPVPAGTLNSVDVETGNQMYGFQIGGSLEFRVAPRCWLNFEGKAAICDNQADQHTLYTTGPLAQPNAPITRFRGEDHTVFAGDLSAALEFQFTPGIVGRIGYQALLIDGLALASENFESNVQVLTLGPAELVHDGSAIYHGPFVGLTVTW